MELRLRILSGVGDLIWSYIDQLTSSDPAEARFMTLSVEALITFNAFLSSPNSSPIDHQPRYQISSAELVGTVTDVLLSDLTALRGQTDYWVRRERTLKACVLRALLWIWRNNPSRHLTPWERNKLFTSSCRLWAPLEKEVASSKTESFSGEDKPLTPDHLKGVLELAEWALDQTLFAMAGYDEDGQLKRLGTSAFITRNADVGINRLYSHFDHHSDWGYYLYDFRDDSASCSRLAYKEDRIL